MNLKKMLSETDMGSKFSYFRLIILSIFFSTALLSKSMASSSCGIMSAMSLARYYGKEVSEKKALELSAAYPKPELNLLDVQKAVAFLGVAVEGSKITLPELREMESPYIALLSDHYVCVESMSEKWVRYVDNGIIKVSTLDEFKGMYSGKSLVVVQGNNLHISPRIIDFGLLPAGSGTREISVIMKNAGSRSININNITTSCSCTVVSQWPTYIPAKEEVSLKVVVNPPKARQFFQFITISSDAKVPNQTILVRGGVETDVTFNPLDVAFGEVVSGSEATKIISIQDDSGKLSRPLHISTTNEQITTIVTPKSANSWDVSVKLAAPPILGELKGEVVISRAGESGPTLRIPAFANIVSMERARPQQMIFGSLGSKVVTRMLTVFRQDNAPLEILGIDSPPYIRCEALPSNERHSEWHVNVSIIPSLAPAQISSKIILKTRWKEQNEIISVPVLALNEGITNLPLPGAVDASQLPRAEDDVTSPIGLPLPLFKVGERAPDFFATDAEGNPWHLSAMRGQKNVLITFFPKCFTGGCASQLASLRDHQSDFDALQIQILAVSVDPAQGDNAQLAFKKKWGLLFPLIPDVDRKLCKQFGAIQNDNERAARLSFLIDKTGVIRYIDANVNVDTHGADIIKSISVLRLK